MVSRRRPRSSPTIRTEASFSSRAMIAAVKPTPTNTTSTFGIVLAMIVPDSRMGVCRFDRHRLTLEIHPMTGVDVEISRISPGEADQLPADHLTVSPVDRVREEALHSIGKQRFEELRGRKCHGDL